MTNRGKELISVYWVRVGENQTGRPGVLQSMGYKESDTIERLN